jgi:CHAT domain-containing protein
LRHDVARQGFRTKFITEYYEPGVLNAELLKRTPDELIQRAGRRLGEIADERTVLLVYDTGSDRGRRTVLCAWLIRADGLVATATTSISSERPFGYLARQSLDVDRRVAPRLPVRRNPAERAPNSEPFAKTSAGMSAEPIAASLEALSQQLMPPPIRQKLVESGTDRILILPVSDLGTVPWSALPLEKGMLVDLASVVVLADVDWILKEGASLCCWWEDENSRALIVGNPDLKDDKNWKFTPIPSAKDEVIAVSKRWPDHWSMYGPLADRDGVMLALRAPAPRRGLIYFATHGISDSRNPMDGSFLALSVDHLYGRDIKHLALGSRPLVVMSACQTGLGKVFEAGVFGLARAWWGAGSEHVVMSLWNVDDVATRDLMIDFINGIKPKDANTPAEPVEEALRQAMINARQRNADPALWASFTVFGLPTPPPQRRWRE